MKHQLAISSSRWLQIWVGIWAVYFAYTYSGIFGLNVTAHFWFLPYIFLLGVLVSIPTFISFYRGRNDKKAPNLNAVVYICAAAWVSYVLLIGSASFLILNRFTMSLSFAMFQLAVILTVPALVVAFLGLMKQRPETETQTESRWLPILTQIVGGLTLVALTAGAYCAVHSLWVPPNRSKFVFANLGNGFGVAAVALILILSYLQKNVYWISLRRTSLLDERQIKVRQEVFETSYKISAVLIVLAIAVLYGHKHSLPAIINDVTNFNVIPGEMFWPFVNVALALVAMPLIVAAYKSRPWLQKKVKRA